MVTSGSSSGLPPTVRARRQSAMKPVRAHPPKVTQRPLFTKLTVTTISKARIDMARTVGRERIVNFVHGSYTAVMLNLCFRVLLVSTLSYALTVQCSEQCFATDRFATSPGQHSPHAAPEEAPPCHQSDQHDSQAPKPSGAPTCTHGSVSMETATKATQNANPSIEFAVEAQTIVIPQIIVLMDNGRLYQRALLLPIFETPLNLRI
jgi:hypothetical protein